ncbi:unnamed protein product [Clavelina lepadiformis]
MMKSKIDLGIIPVLRVPKPIVVDSTWTIIGESSNTIHKLASQERQQTPKDEASSTGIASSGQTTNETSLASTSSTNFSNNNLSERILAKRMKALRKKYQRNKIKKDQSYGRIEITNLNQKTYPVREEEIKQNNSCPICLDIYYKPTKCLPCAHMFCDPCLRQFSLYSDLVTCPVCRQDIASFKEINGLSTKLRQLFSNEYKWRQKQVKRLKINQINLPQPVPQAQFQHVRLLSLASQYILSVLAVVLHLQVSQKLFLMLLITFILVTIVIAQKCFKQIYAFVF